MKKYLILIAAIIVFILNAACKKDVTTIIKRPVFKEHGLSLDTTYSIKSIPPKVITSTKDTLLITATTTTIVKVTYDTMVHKYVVPIYVYKRPKYRVYPASSFSNQNGLVVSLDSINSNFGNVNQMTFTNCNNLHITKCYFTNTTGFALTLNNCSNVVVDSCVLKTVAFGIKVNGGSNIKINHNQGLNRYDVGNTGGERSHWVQFLYVNGGGNQVNYNKFEDITGQAIHPHDGISIWNSNGMQGDSIQVIGNWLRGGQQFGWPTSTDTGVGITISDAAGNFQVCRNNILVNCGYEGIICYSSGTGIKVDHNAIFSSGGGNALVGAAVGNSHQIYYGYNRVNWTNSTGQNTFNTNGISQYWLSTSTIPVDWNKNIWQDKTLTSSILPATIITWK